MNIREETNDPVADLVLATSAEHMTEWLGEYHGLDAKSAETVIRNLRGAFRWHRLQGRLDHCPEIAALAQVWQLRQDVKALATPKTPDA